MGNPRGVRRDFERLEKRRMAAVELLGEGLNNSEVGRRLGVCNQTVSRWRAEYEAGGRAALRQARRAGRKPRLSTGDEERLVERLLEGPQRHGFPTPLWTCDRVARLINREFGVRYHAGHVWKILRGLNWSPQRPVGRARERNEERIQEWKQQRWPAIKKKPKRRAARSFSLTKAG